jgi:hypothetical protein
MPVFEFITTESNVLPSYENIVKIPQKHFAISARKKAKGKIIITLNGSKTLRLNYLKIVSLLKHSKKFRFFPDFVIKFGAMMFLRIKK